MATYSEIQEWIKKHHKCSVKTCYIADVKEMCGLSVRRAPNRKNIKKRKNPCPTKKIGIIKDALKQFGMI